LNDLPATSGFSQTSINLYDSAANFLIDATPFSIYLFIFLYFD